MGHAQVLEAAVIAVPHPRWQERPLACVCLKPDFRSPEHLPAIKDDLLAHLAAQFPRWSLPDEVVFVDSLPKTSTGKFDKKALRKLYASQ
jgi:fatty-acyl-CoA synthase